MLCFIWNNTQTNHCWKVFEDAILSRSNGLYPTTTFGMQRKNGITTCCQGTYRHVIVSLHCASKHHWRTARVRPVSTASLDRSIASGTTPFGGDVMMLVSRCYLLSVGRGDMACMAAMTCSCLATCSTCSAYFLFRLSICCSMVSMSACCFTVLPARSKFCSSVCSVAMNRSSVLLLSSRTESLSRKLFTCSIPGSIFSRRLHLTDPPCSTPLQFRYLGQALQTGPGSKGTCCTALLHLLKKKAGWLDSMLNIATKMSRS